MTPEIEKSVVVDGPPEDDADAKVAKAPSPYIQAFKKPKGIVGFSLVGTLVLLALLSPWLFPGGYDEQGRDSLYTASLDHPFGTDQVGRDIFVRSIYALRTDLSLIFVAVTIAAVIGTLLGLTGVLSRRLGNASQRIFDVILGFPGLVLGITIAAILDPGWKSLVITITILSIPGFGRIARSQLLSEQEKEYVLAVRVLGVPKWRVLTRHILPNVLEPAVVQVALAMVLGIFIESALSLVGLGIQPPNPSIGTLLNASIRFMSVQPYYVLGPMVTLLLLTLGLNLIADSLNASLEER